MKYLLEALGWPGARLAVLAEQSRAMRAYDCETTRKPAWNNGPMGTPPATLLHSTYTRREHAAAIFHTRSQVAVQ